MRTLVIGNKTHSSWSLRPWFLMTHAGIPFEEKVIALDLPSTAGELRAVSPSGKVPVLIDGELKLWESIAICEHLAEQFPEKALWPKDPSARAMARSVAAEMHAGFASLREQCPTWFLETHPTPALSAQTRADIERVKAIWTTARARFGQGGPFLFGAFSIADAMFAPVVSRLRTYQIPLEGEAAQYAEMIWKLSAIAKWLEGARAESFPVPDHG